MHSTVIPGHNHAIVDSYVTLAVTQGDAIGPKGVGTGYGEINGVNDYEDESLIN